MLKIKTVPVLTRIIAKLDLNPAIAALKEADIFAESKDKAEALKQLTNEKAAELAFQILAAVTPQLDKIGEDIPEFVALYKGVSLEEAGEMDLAEIVNDVIHDEGITGFFKNALRKKAEREV